jgi:molecular chaperone DnaJ
MGMPRLHGSGRGNEMVQVFVETPARPTSDEREVLRKLAELETANVTPERKRFATRVEDYLRQRGK